MTVKTLIQEAMNKNPLGFKEAMKEELKSRIGLALEAKMKSQDDEASEDDEESNEDEAC